MASAEGCVRVVLGSAISGAEISRLAALFAANLGLPGESARIARTAQGKPYFPDLPGVRFSVSHSEGLFALALADREIGVDLQAYRPCRTEAVARRFFHPLEAAYVAEGPPDRFFAVWTAKESYVKYTGEGITETFSSFSTVADNRICPAVDGVRLRHLPVKPQYSLCLCGGGDNLCIQFVG